MIDLSKIDGRKFYIGVGALLLVAIGQAIVPAETEHFIHSIQLMDFSTVEGQGWGAWMLWAFRSALEKIQK